MSDLLDTKVLEKYVLYVYNKAIPLIKEDGISMPINTIFRKNTPHNSQGEFCFTDQDGYHFRVLERGTLYHDDIMQSLSEITYWAKRVNFPRQLLFMRQKIEFRIKIFAA